MLFLSSMHFNHNLPYQAFGGNTREGVKKFEYNLHLFAFSVFRLNVKRWGDFSVISLQKAETETSVRFSSVFRTPAAASAGHSWLIRDVPSVYGLTRWSFNE